MEARQPSTLKKMVSKILNQFKINGQAVERGQRGVDVVC